MDLKSLLIWFLRIPYCRGFGIHSPTDYRFVRYVINEHYPYYAYMDLLKEFPLVSHQKRNLSKLYFRIANWKQPERALLLSSDCEMYKSYVKRGCNKSIADNIPLESNYDFIIIGNDNHQIGFEGIVQLLKAESVIVIESIHAENKCLWKRLLKWEKATICYDLYYAGIVLLDDKREKRQYKICF